MKTNKLLNSFYETDNSVETLVTVSDNNLNNSENKISCETDANTYSDYEYEMLGYGAVEITKYRGLADSITIPKEIGGKSVVSICDSAFENNETLTCITIPYNVTDIEECAFYGCPNLKYINVNPDNEYYASVDGVLFNKDKTVLIKYPSKKTDTLYTIPDSVSSIESFAFCGCTELTSVVISEKVKDIGGDIFSLCTNLSSIIVPESNSHFCSSEGVLYNKDKTELICCPRARTSLTIPYGVTTIAIGAFHSCLKLSAVVIPNSVKEIGDVAFSKCSKLTSVNIPDSVTSVGLNAFTGTAIVDNQSSDVKYINGWVVGYDGDNSSVEIKEGTVGIATCAFDGAQELKSIALPNGLKYIGGFVFIGCRELVNVNIPDSVQNVGPFAFNGAAITNNQTSKEKYVDGWVVQCEDDAVSINIKDGTKAIADNAFAHIESLTSVMLPDSVRIIGNYAFCDCYNLRKITIPDSVTSIAETAFEGTIQKDILTGEICQEIIDEKEM